MSEGLKTEIEVKFLAVDHDDVRQALKKAGATLLEPMRMMRRTVFDWPDGQLESAVDGYLRVRDEGDKVTVTYKQFNEALSIDGSREIETTVGDYQTTVQLFQAIGMKVKSQQESRRETWQFDECEIVLDEWPWLKPYFEIEGPHIEALKKAAAALGFLWEQAVSGSVTSAYRAEYDIPRERSIGDAAEVRFDLPVPQWLATLKRKEEQ